MAIHTFGDTKLRVELDEKSEAIQLRLTDLTSGKSWGPAPLLALEIYDRMQLRVDRLEQYRVEQIESIPQGVHVTINDEMRRVRLGLWLSVEAGELSFRLPPAELQENRKELYRIFAVDVLPGLLRVDRNGEMFLPLTTGVLSKPANKPALSDSFMIYGEQARWELLPTIPVCAVQSPEGGVTIVATQGAAETQCRVSTDGKGNGQVGFAFFFRSHFPDVYEFSNREFRFVPLAAKDDITIATAKRLRKHVMQDLGKPTLQTRIKENPDVAYLIEANIMKLFFGVLKQGLMLNANQAADPQFFLAMTFDEAIAGLKKLKDAGIEKIYGQAVGWNPRGHDGAYPTRFPIEDRVGGEKGFREMYKVSRQLGYQMTVHDNYSEMYESSPDFDLDTVVRDIYGAPMVRGFWGGGISYLNWPLSFTDKHLGSDMRKLKEMGVAGPYYLDGMGSPLYPNNDPKHPGTRTGHQKGLDRILQVAREIYGSCATETGFLYCSLTTDLINSPGNDWLLGLCHKEWPITQLIDRRVPAWQLTMSGLIMSENHEETWHQTMRCVLMGQSPRVEWSSRPGIHPVLDDALVKKIKAKYDIAVKKFGRLKLHEMLTWKRDGEIETTTWDDGTKVEADFKTNELRVNNERIECPEALR